ncbi:ABC transporter permease [Nocardia goodfellowii]|uniref:Simple sugar transport system permease protein n=1 Tax=Nocardia goodfellowii TaxID=882446 RepID=A0ABS4QUY8_9NOCA|nr:ABC transporter permease [Nocardia goodfellowii]MBP2194426.1 simple sugar transport system permease protein [Nocardia goodfellowii]
MNASTGTEPQVALSDKVFRRRTTAAYGLAGAGLLLGGAGLPLIDSGRTTTYRLDQTVDTSWTIGTLVVVATLSALAVLAGIALLTLPPPLARRFDSVLIGGAVAALVIAALSWTVTPGVGFPVEFVLATTLFLALPFIFGALSGVVAERSGVINLGIEGQFLTGAFTAALLASVTGNAYLGMLAATLSGVCSTLLLAWLATRFQVNQVVTGIILNLLALGLTGFLYERLMRADGSLNQPATVRKVGDSLGFLADIPILGPVLFDQNIFVYVALVCVFAVSYLLFRTRWGLRTRAVGEHPAAADAAGINVNRLRFWNVTVAGALSGFGGAFFTIANNVSFSKNMTAGLGFVALAVMIVGRWHPFGVLTAALLFGFSSALQRFLNTMPGNPIPTEFLGMLPYAVTLVVVAGFIGRAVAPAADGIPYTPGSK